MGDLAPRLEYELIFDNGTDPEFRVILPYDGWIAKPNRNPPHVSNSELVFTNHHEKTNFIVSRRLLPSDLVGVDRNGANVDYSLNDLIGVQWGFAEREMMVEGQSDPVIRAYKFVSSP